MGNLKAIGFIGFLVGFFAVSGCIAVSKSVSSEDPVQYKGARPVVEHYDAYLIDGVYLDASYARERLYSPVIVKTKFTPTKQLENRIKNLEEQLKETKSRLYYWQHYAWLSERELLPWQQE